MRWILMSLAAVCAGCSPVAPQAAIASQAPAAPEAAYAIPNTLRPGANAPSCPTTEETPDGCTFHIVNSTVQQARFTASSDASWIARVGDAGTMQVSTVDDATTPEGVRYQVFEFVPNSQADIDTTITFDKLTGAPGAQQVVERRRVAVMSHAW